MKSKTHPKLNFNSDQELADFLLENLTDSLKQSVRITVKIMIKQEMDNLRKEINEKLSFNGYYHRNMVSSLGKIDNIDVPRFREKNISNMDLKSTNIFDQEKDNFLNIVAKMHQAGISQRKIAKLCKTCFGINVSKNRTGLVHRELAQQEEFRINDKILEDEFIYLLLDGIWMKCKNYGYNDNNKAVLLCALGIKSNGERKIIGFKFAYKEDYDSWHEFVLGLKKRGLIGKNLKLIISDDNGSLTKSISQAYPDKPVQVCITHKLRNVILKTSYKRRKQVASEAKIIYQAKNKKQAMDTAEKFCKKWFVAEEKAVRTLRFDFEKTLTYFDFPEQDWKQIRTTNILEREFREVRRRIKVFDNSFNDPNSVDTYANSIFNYLNNNYPAHLHTKC